MYSMERVEPDVDTLASMPGQSVFAAFDGNPVQARVIATGLEDRRPYAAILGIEVADGPVACWLIMYSTMSFMDWRWNRCLVARISRSVAPDTWNAG